MSRQSVGQTDGRGSRRYICSPCHEDTPLEGILCFDNHFLERAAMMTEEEVRTRFHQCPTAFYCIFQEVDGRPHLRGYFVVLPLTVSCASAIRCGEITAGRQILPTDLVPPNEPAEAAYLSVVCGVGARARAALIAEGVQAVRNLYRDLGTRFLFARAATDAGARILTRLTRQKFIPDGIIHEIDLSRYRNVTLPE